MEEESWRRNLEEKLWRRSHAKGILRTCFVVLKQPIRPTLSSCPSVIYLRCPTAIASGNIGAKWKTEIAGHAKQFDMQALKPASIVVLAMQGSYGKQAMKQALKPGSRAYSVIFNTSWGECEPSAAWNQLCIRIEEPSISIVLVSYLFPDPVYVEGFLFNFFKGSESTLNSLPADSPSFVQAIPRAWDLRA